jgi:Protein of unknown function (DUF1275)
MAGPDLSFLNARKPKLLIALRLTFAEGIVAISGYLRISHMFTAHLTGITVELGSKLSEHAWAAGVRGGRYRAGVRGRLAFRARGD